MFCLLHPGLLKVIFILTLKLPTPTPELITADLISVSCDKINKRYLAKLLRKGETLPYYIIALQNANSVKGFFIKTTIVAKGILLRIAINGDGITT